MNKVVKNTLLVILMAGLGVLCGIGGSKLIEAFHHNDQPQITFKQETISSISQTEAMKKVTFDVLIPSYFKNEKILYYVFPEGRLKVDFEQSSSKIPVASLDITSMDQVTSNLPSDEEVSFSYGIAHIKRNQDKSVIWFTRDNTYYQLVIQNQLLPQDEMKVRDELKKIISSFQMVSR